MNHLNELIALELGWRDLSPAMDNIGRGQSTGIPPGKLRTYVPNWAGSLDLMHILESDLTTNQHVGYLSELYRLVGKNSDDHSVTWTLRDTYLLAHATAEQKAIAWLKVKGVEV